jgi:acyl carrier protein
VTVQTLPDNPHFAGVYRTTADSGFVAAVAPRAFLSVPEVRAALCEILATQAHRLTFTVLHAGEGLDTDALGDDAAATRKFHRTKTPEGPVESLLAERVSLTLPEDAVLSMTDDVRDLGGDSLFCLELSEAVLDTWNVEIEPVDIFRVESLAALAADIEARR